MRPLPPSPPPFLDVPAAKCIPSIFLFDRLHKYPTVQFGCDAFLFLRRYAIHVCNIFIGIIYFIDINLYVVLNRCYIYLPQDRLIKIIGHPLIRIARIDLNCTNQILNLSTKVFCKVIFNLNAHPPIINNHIEFVYL